MRDSAKTANTGIKYLLITNFFLNFVLSGGMRYMLELIRYLQLVINFSILSINLPANVCQLFSIIVPVVTFDIFDADWTTKLVLEFDQEGQEEFADQISGQMADLGYETHNALLNLGSLALFSMIWFVVLVLLLFSMCF